MPANDRCHGPLDRFGSGCGLKKNHFLPPQTSQRLIVWRVRLQLLQRRGAPFRDPLWQMSQRVPVPQCEQTLARELEF
jgi:hypothetical protein